MRIVWLYARIGALSLALFVVSGAAGCRDAGRADRLPEGAWLAGRSAALDRILAGAEGLQGTPIAAGASRARRALGDCERFVAQAPPDRLASLPDRIECQQDASLPDALARLLGEDDLAFVLPLADGARLLGHARLDPDGGVRLGAWLDGVPTHGFAQLLIPSEAEAGKPRLAGGESLLHARFRPEGGLGLADRIASGGQADRLFKLKSRIFEGSVLGGAWELVVYSPRPGRGAPGLALGLDVAFRSAAEVAMREFVSELEQTWPIVHTPARFGEWPGACFFDLRILPEFAPCYVLSETALVVGWNPESIQLALGEAGEPELGSAGGLVVHLDRFPEADERLRTAWAPDSPAIGFDYGWQRLAVTSHRRGASARDMPSNSEGDSLRLEIELVARSGSL